MKTRSLFLVLATFFAASMAWADGLIIIHNPPPIHRPHPRPHVFAPLQVVFHHVEVAIDGQKATTRVDQEFFNPNDATLEGDYLFPVPAGAHIDKFTMKIGDRDMEAELLDATKARKIYEDIVRQQRDPALLEYTGRPAFRVRIFPIEPRSRKKVSLSYTELLKADAGLVSYVYPLNTEKFSAEPLKTVSIKVALDERSPIKALYSPTHAVKIERDGGRKATVTFEESNTRPDRDFQLLFSTGESEVGLSLLTQKAGSDDGYFLLLASPGADVVKSDQTNPKDVVFVVDTSGSMAGKKLAQAKKALNFCVENLNDTDRFEVLRFSTEAEPCFDKLVGADKASREQAEKWIDALKPIGGTAIHEALGRALQLRPATSERPFVVIFLTDGKPTVGETNEDKIVASVAPGNALGEDEVGAATRIFCFGIGADVNTHLLDKIVERTRAASQFVLPEEDLELKVSSFFTKIKEPLLTNLKIAWPQGIRVSKVYPNPLPDLFRGDQLVLTGRFSGSGEGEAAIEGMLNGEAKKIAQRVNFSAGETGHDFIPQLWAMRRVGFLLDEIRLRGENAELRDEVVDLARRYAIVTPYTSYLIVEDEARRNVPTTMRSLQSLDRSASAQARLRESWRGLSEEKVGRKSNFDARSNQALKYADALAPARTLSKEESENAVVAGAASAPAEAATAEREMRAIDQDARVVNGKTFFQNGAQWIDAESQQQKKDAKRQQIKFASDEYFKLLTDNSDAAQWLALGRNVQFALGDVLYEVTD
ncbi:MAG: VIT domain-containing protein [Chthoniobacteraceae bacterium]